MLTTQSCVSGQPPSSGAFREESRHNSENQEQQHVILFPHLEFVFVGMGLNYKSLGLYYLQVDHTDNYLILQEST